MLTVLIYQLILLYLSQYYNYEYEIWYVASLNTCSGLINGLIFIIFANNSVSIGAMNMKLSV